MSCKRTRQYDSSQSPEKKRLADERTARTVSEFYEREDREALSMNMTSIMNLFLEQSKQFKQELVDVFSISNQVSSKSQCLGGSLISRFISLRRLNRFAQYHNRQLRESVNRERAIVEGRFLQLQNIRSEIEHLQREISRCFDFRSADEDIEMIPIEEFYARAPAVISQEEITRHDKHRQHLARLNWEMEERKNLLGTLQEREGRKNVLITDITTKEHRLKSLKPRIEALIEASKPVQELMGLTCNPINTEKERILSLLPPELSVIAILVEAYCDIVEEPGILLKCKGDYESAVKFLENRQQEFEITERMDGGNREDNLSLRESLSLNDGRRMTMKEVIAARKDFVIAPHPVHIEVEITCQDQMCVILVLQFIPGLHAVGTIVKFTGAPASVYKDLFFGQSLLDLLFDEDENKCISNAGKVKLDLLEISVADLENKTGRLYGFIQEIAGLSEVAANNSQLCEVMHSVLVRIRSRVDSRCALAKITHSLRALIFLDKHEGFYKTEANGVFFVIVIQVNKIIDNLKLFEELKSRESFPDVVCSELTDFRMITAEQFFENEAVTNDYRKLIESEGGMNTTKHFYFSATVERNPDAKLHALIFVHVRYPNVKPIYILSCSLDFSSELTQLERVLNADFSTFVSCNNLNYILEFQMAFLVSRFDVFLESSSNATNGSQFTREHLLVHPYRGRDHQLPLYYKKDMNAFTFVP
ncbi:unnamed protein product [Thelazia callipaeda]|uniref:Protein kinase domain-containing protein n=1 Tax=Thelazia callipaeda TaxID=103827 RepID=A0A0N5CWX8_THECL|nr:unnamed protein product [Thelazia callipaeda]